MAVQRRTQAFRTNTRAAMAARALMRDALLQQPMLRVALTRYLASLDLQGRVNRGQLTPNQALVEFEKAIHTFSRRIHTELNKQWAKNAVDQTDLSNPLNMQAALQNPSSTANQLMIDTQAAVEQAINTETQINEQNYNQAMQSQAEQTATQTNTAPAYSDAEKTDAVVAAMIVFDEKGVNAAQGKIESAFFKETGLESDFHKVAAEAEHDEPSFLQKVLRPEYKPNYQDDEKNKG